MTIRLALSLGCLLALITPASISAQERAPSPSPQVHAIVIGVNQYEDPTFPSCKTAVRDSITIGNWFIRTAGWKPRQVLLLNDNGDALPGDVEYDGLKTIQPTRANLLWAFNQWLDARAKPGDRIVVYFAGQATGQPPGRKEALGKTFLLPSDANHLDLVRTAVVLDEVLQARASRGENSWLVWLDTSTLGRGAGIPAVKGAPNGADWLRTLARWPGASAWLAASGRPAPDGQGVSPFVQGVAEALGDPSREARTLLGTLASLHRSAALRDQGFQTLGGVDPSWSIWSSSIRVAAPPTPELVFQRGHADRVTAVRATADGDRLVTASQDSTIRIWRASDGVLLRVLTDPLGGVTHLVMSPDGRTIVYGDGAGRVQGWDLVEDRLLRQAGPPFHEDPITGLAFLPGGKRFVTIDSQGKSGAWQIASTRLEPGPFTDQPLACLSASTEGSPVALAVASLEGKIYLFDASLKSARELDGPGGTVSALDLSPDGRTLGIGNDAGEVVVWDLTTGVSKPLAKGPGAGPNEIKVVRVGQGPFSIVADASTAWVVSGGVASGLLGRDGKPWTGQADSIEVSPDGRWLALATRVEGMVSLWALDGTKPPAPVDLVRGDGECLALGFSPDGNTLLSGDWDGGIRRWTLSRPGEPRAASIVRRIDAGRGKVAQLAASPSGKYLLEVTRDEEAIVWDLEEGRAPRRIPGKWTGGTFLAGDDRLALLTHPDQGGKVVLINRGDGSRLARIFATPPTRDGKTSEAAFGSLAVSKSGRWIAAASIEAQAPIACVWDAASGELVHFTRSHDAGLTSLDLSADESHLLTASLDGSVKVWSLKDPTPEWTRPMAELRHEREGADAGVAAARFSPGDPRKVATGTRGGWITYWTLGEGRPTGRDLTRLGGAVNALAFSADGKWLSGSGMLDKSARLWTIADPLKSAPQPARLMPLPHHVEQVTTLAFVPGGKILATGSDDATVRFWDLGARDLLGTVAATPGRTRVRGGREVQSETGLDWLAYTPNGLFDGSEKGEGLVRWRVGDEIQTVEQYQDTHFRFGLMGTLAQSRRPEPPRLEGRNARRIAIVSPREEFSTVAREVDLTIALDAADTTGLRLYQDGVPIQAETDFAPGESPTRVVSRVKLRSGANRFYALASRPGAIDGRSNEVLINYEGPEPPGRLHVLAVGISAYERRKLKYAHADAQSLSAFLHQKGIAASGEPGSLFVRTDADATEQQINKDFIALRDAVKGRPEDTVVVFLAGHTDVFRDQFYLLLPGFPFPDAPAAQQVALRGDLNPGGYVPKVEDPNLLSYVRIYNRMTRLDALQRLVIVDACQAGAILSDPAVKKVQALLEGGARKARNAYLVASRRGEPATEADALSHGLLTYVLLRGMGETGLKAIEEDRAVFGAANADLNRDGMVTTEELRSYAELALPRLSARFPELVRRSGGAGRNERGNPPATELEQGARTQGTETSFPLVPLKPR